VTGTGTGTGTNITWSSRTGTGISNEKRFRTLLVMAHGTLAHGTLASGRYISKLKPKVVFCVTRP
jgi:hypothetical protein